jgi:AraC family transcriptional regulator, ethanolamine operon transcriptional activator
VSVFLGQEVGGHDAIIVRSPSEGLLRTPEGFRLHTITVPVSLLEGTLESFGMADLSSVLATSKLLRFSPRLLGRFHTLLALRAGSAPEVLDWNTDREIEQETLRLVSEGLLGFQSEKRRPRALRNRVLYVREACARIEERLAEDVILTDVAKSVGISLRSLENAFVEILGVRPVEYVRMRRLHKVRAHLLKHGTFDGVLGQVASRFGLRHLSYFSRDYKMLFGELPSSTVRH